MKTVAAVQAFLNNRRSANLSPRTLHWYEYNLNRFAAFTDELPTDPETIEQFLIGIVADNHEEARHGYYRVLKAFYRFICKRHRLANPIDLIDAPARHKKVRPTLDDRELGQLCNQPTKLRDRTLVTLFIDTGVRAGEAASLKVKNIFDDYIVVDGKTGQREVPISEETRYLLLSLVEANSSESDHVFLGEQGAPLTTWGIYKIVRKYLLAAGVTGPKLGPHRIRHAFGKNYIKSGGDTRSLQKIMGHANITTTEIYVELSAQEIITKHHQFSPLRSAHAAAQGNLFDVDQVVKEAEEIMKGGKAKHAP